MWDREKLGWLVGKKERRKQRKVIWGDPGGGKGKTLERRISSGNFKYFCRSDSFKLSLNKWKSQ